MSSVYLAGPINCCTDDECMGWRAEAKRLLEPMFDIIDPMDFDCRGREDLLAVEIVQNDIYRIGMADVVLVNATRPSWGTAMEMVYANQAEKVVVAFTGDGKVSPWVRRHANECFKTLGQACFELMNWPPIASGLATARQRRSS